MGGSGIITDIKGNNVTYNAITKTEVVDAELGTKGMMTFVSSTWRILVNTFLKEDGSRKSTPEILSMVNFASGFTITDTLPTITTYLPIYLYLKELQTAYRSFGNSILYPEYKYNHNTDYSALNQLIQSKMSIAETDAKIQQLTELKYIENVEDNNDQILYDAVTSAFKEYNAFNFAGLNASLATRLQECGASVSTKYDCFSNYQSYNQKTGLTTPITDVNTNNVVDNLVNADTDSINANHNNYLHNLYKNADLQMSLCTLFDDTSMKPIIDPMSQLKKM